MRRKLSSVLLALGLLVSAGGVACDKEDKKDVEEVGDNIDQEVDDADSDGKDD